MPIEVDFAIEGNPLDVKLDDDQWAVLAETATATVSPGASVVVNASGTIADGERATPVAAGKREAKPAGAPGAAP